MTGDHRTMTINEILVALDGKQTSERSVPVAVTFAKQLGCGIRLLTFVEEDHDIAEAQKQLGHIKAQLRSKYADLSCAVTVEIEPHAPDGLVRYGTADSLLAMATSGKIMPHGHYIGSAAEAVVRRSPYPALLVGPQCQWNEDLSIDRVVVPVDGDELSEQAVPTAATWASRLSVPAWVVTVIDPRDRSYETMPRLQMASYETTYVHNVASRFADRRSMEWEVLHGSPPAALGSFTDETTLTVMASHGRGGAARLVLGSVTAKFVKLARGPVLVQKSSVCAGEGEPRETTISS